MALTHAAAFTAIPTAALLALWLAPAAPERWWLLLVIGSLGALFSWYFRRNLPESPRWSVLAGRPEEAAATLEHIEKAVGREAGPSPEPVAEASSLPVRPMPFWEIWSPRYRRRTLMMVVFHLLQPIGYYGFMHWLVTVLRDAKGLPYDDALRIQLCAFLLAPVGPLLGVWSSERSQRKWLIVGLTLVLASMQVAFGLAEGAVLLIPLAALIVVGLNWFSAVFHAYQAELFPDRGPGDGCRLHLCLEPGQHGGAEPGDAGVTGEILVGGVRPDGDGVRGRGRGDRPFRAAYQQPDARGSLARRASLDGFESRAAEMLSLPRQLQDLPVGGRSPGPVDCRQGDFLPLDRRIQMPRRLCAISLVRLAHRNAACNCLMVADSPG